MISIILPVYNASATLARAIDSILAQSFADFELIAVDDGSTDGSGAILDAFAQKDSRIRVFHKPNGGANSARNLGLEHVCGEFVTFCDADDYVDSDWLQSFADNLEDNDVVIQGWKYVRQGKTEPIYYENTPSDPARAADVMSGMESFGFLVTKCFRFSIICENRLRFNESFRFMEDEEFICRYWASVKHIQFAHVAAYNYIVPDFDRKYDGIDNFELYRSLLDHAGQFLDCSSESITLRKYSMGLFRCMMLPYHRRDYKEGWHRLQIVVSYSKRCSRHNKFLKLIRTWNTPLWHIIISIHRCFCFYTVKEIH